MVTVDRVEIRAPIERVLHVAADVERWPQILPHYRWVRFLERRNGGATVEMAAWRPFGAFRYPTWWVSEMMVDRGAREIRYRHVRGITRRMDVAWRLVNSRRRGSDHRARVGGPGVAADRSVGRPARDRAGIHPWDRVRTLAGIKRYAEGTTPLQRQ